MSGSGGAVPDETALGILGWMAEGAMPFVMECADRTAADRKGGHLAQDLSGQLVLREVAQCPNEDVPAFQDINRHKYFNTNNLWFHRHRRSHHDRRRRRRHHHRWSWDELR